MKAGKFWFSVPNPYVVHDPKLGRTKRASPQFINNSDGSWLGTLAWSDRSTVNSSITSPTLEKISLTSIPLSPYFLNLKGDGRAAPVLRSVRKVFGISRPAYFSSAGLGSNVSICEQPPLRK